MENWCKLSHLFVTVFFSSVAEMMLSPAMPDVTLAAVCPGKDECSAAIYLTGVQQLVTGLGSVIMMPLLGNLSDIYGRKLFLAIPLFFSIIPSFLLAWKRTKTLVYAYYVIKTLTGMVTQTGILVVSLAYLADNVSAKNRVSAFGILSGVLSAAFLGGTFASRILPTNQIFQVAAGLSILSLIYMGVFLKETASQTDDALEQPILKATESNEDGFNTSKKIILIKKIPSPSDVLRLLKSSVTLSLAALVSFFNSLADAGLQTCLLYFLKARFHFGKDQMADILLITYAGAAISNVILVPALGPRVGEETMLCFGLFSGFLNMFFDSIAWAPWVPYASAATGVFLFITPPAVRSIISKQVGPSEQGLAQGCLLGVTALANVISPLIYSPLSAAFLSEHPPFHFQGFSILCVGFAWLSGFIVSIVIKVITHSSKNRDRNMASTSH